MSKHIITIGIPPAELSANSSAHWAVVGPLKKELRRKVCDTIKNLHPELVGAMWESGTIQYKFYFGCVRVRDDDNADSRMKSARDALSPTTYYKSGKKAGQVRCLGVGVVVDDNRLTELPTVMDIDRENPRVEIHIEETRKETE